jgi:hypothetical protein
MSEKKAVAVFKTASNGVPVLELSMNGQFYGDYPVSDRHNAAAEIRMLINDVKDYGYSEVTLIAGS